MTAVATRPGTTPFKGLANYTEEDAALFFGRDREREIIISNLKVRRLSLLYGESGVGKSSLLRAGVAARLSELARDSAAEIGTPEFVPVVFSSWSDDPMASLDAAIRAAVAEFGGDALPASGQGLSETIAAAARSLDAYLLIILDQFEEYFLYHPYEVGAASFAEQFPRALNRSGLQAGFLVSIREDGLAKLDRFKRDVPGLFDTFLRVEHLDRAAGRGAILLPIERHNELSGGEPFAIEPALVEAVLDQVRTGEVTLEQRGHGALPERSAAGDGGDHIETPYLQLVMTRLWDSEQADGSRTLRLATLTRLGGAQQIVRTHLDAALTDLAPDERDAAASIFHHLVTPSGSKIAHRARDLAEYTGHPQPEVERVLDALAGSATRIIRPVPPAAGDGGPPRFEIFHDVLAPSILDWRARQTAARRIAEEQRASRAATRRLLVRLGAVVALLATVAVALFANAQRNDAQRRAAQIRSDAALTREFAAFNSGVRMRYFYSQFGNVRIRFLFVRVFGPPGASVRVWCRKARRCDTTTTTIPRGGTLSLLRGAVLPRGGLADLVVTQGDKGKHFQLTFTSRVESTSESCRPPGATAPLARVAAPCPV